jgi:2-aminoadipate transaminase
MVEDLDSLLSEKVRSSKRSVIRELLKLINKPNIISFAGGLPSPEGFPTKEVQDICNELIPKVGKKMLQYGATEGDPGLQEELVKRANKQGMNVTKDNLLITSSSQQGLDLLGKVFIDKGDPVIVEKPTYLGGLSAFKNFGADFHGIPLDNEGMNTDELKKTIENIEKTGKKIKFIYIVPDFQNPSGVTMSLQRRKETIKIAKEHDLLIVEDSPYRELRYVGEHIPTLYSLDDSNRVILLGTFSKTFAPGFRLGWVFANEQIIDKFVISKQATDLCTSPFTQKIAAEFLKRGLLEKQIDKVKKEYKEKRKIMLESLEKYMPEGVTWTDVEGGLFLFVTAPEHVDLEANFQKAVDKNVAYVIGNAFTHDNTLKNSMRINYSYENIEKIKEGVKILGEFIKSLI